MPEEQQQHSLVSTIVLVLVVLILAVGVFEYFYLRASDDGASGFDEVRQLVLRERTRESAAFAGSCPVDERIVFSGSATEKLNESDIYIACLSTGALYNITNDQNGSFAPQLSPNGTTVYYYAPRDSSTVVNDWEIWRSDISGTNKVRLTDNPLGDTFPTLSPDGTRLAFISQHNDSVWRLHTMNTDGTNEVTIPSQNAFNATFHTDDALVFTQENSQGLQDLFEYNIDTQELRQLTNNDVQESSPAVSPDGAYILYGTNETGNFEVYRLDTETNAVSRLTNTAGNSGTAVFSRDGNKVVFASDRGGTSALYQMTVNGTNQELLIHGLDLRHVRNPAFAPSAN